MYQSDALPRRPFLGFELRKQRSTDAARSGLEVVHVVPDGAAAQAGVCPGDWLEFVNQEPIGDAQQLIAYVRTLAPGAPLEFVVDRHGEKLTLRGKLIPLPVEQVAHADVHLEHLVVAGHRRRVILTMPKNAPPPYTTVLYLQGLGTQSCELFLDQDEPLRKLLEGFSQAGLATVRVERSGMGDSEGPPFFMTDLFDEAAGYREALALLAHDSRVKNVVLFGHSVGGMLAPLLAGEGTNVQGIVVFGTSALRWVDCIVRATRRQKVLAGMTGEELETYVEAWTEMHETVCQGAYLPWQVFERSPHLKWLEGTACRGETMFGRHAVFFQQLERLDLVALWKTVQARVLVMHGQFDWACGADEGKAIATSLAEIDPQRVDFVEFDSMGHDMRRHTSLQASYTNPRQGEWDERIVQTAVEWIRRIVS